jgi:hypothetical protein
MMIGRIALSPKLPWLPAKATALVLADYLDTDHDHRLLLSRVDLARHGRGTRLVLRQQQVAGRPQRGPEARQRMSLPTFISATRARAPPPSPLPWRQASLAQRPMFSARAIRMPAPCG